MVAQIVAELPWYTLASLLMWTAFYFPIGFYSNAQAADQSHERAILMLLLFWVFLLWVSTFAHLCVSFSPGTEEGANTASLMFFLAFFFCGVLASPDEMPGFWIFIYRASPLSYFVSATLSTGLANVNVTCASNEFTIFDPPKGQTCGGYMSEYISQAGGYLLDSLSTKNCQYCKIKETNIYLEAVSSDYSIRWRNFGIMWAFVLFNIVGALALYWVVRVPKGKNK
jgi:ABC-type multidrug transport system permease subunit